MTEYQIIYIKYIPLLPALIGGCCSEVCPFIWGWGGIPALDCWFGELYECWYAAAVPVGSGYDGMGCVTPCTHENT